MVNTLNDQFQQVRCMQHLQYLDLSENEFEEFSQDFGVLRALRLFNISKNKISSMPCKYLQVEPKTYPSV